jgi:transcription-repair coupling factor (superfamily II helicase)
MYKRLAEVRSDDDVALLREELVDRYGEPPAPVESLLEVARFRARARQAGLTDVTIQGNYVRLAPVELPDSAKVRLGRLYPRSLVKDNVRTILVPRPSTAPIGGQPIRDLALLSWTREVVDAVVDRKEMQPS